MLYVICPNCQAWVELADDAISPERTDPWNVIGCYECGSAFDYDDEDVIKAPNAD